MKQRVRIHKAAEAVAEEGDVVVVAPQNRLTGISVNEVSIVDRAANQRKYLVVKDFPPHPAPPAVAPPAAPVAAPAPPTAPMAISPEVKAKLATVLKTATDQITALTAAVAGATDTPGAAVPPPVVAALTALGGLFASAVAPAAPAVAPAPPVPPHVPPPPPGAVGKAGRKISASRLAQLLSAKTALDSILAEVTGNEEPAGDEPEKTEAKKEEVAPAAEPAEASAELTDIKASLDSLAAVVGKMTTVFAGQNQRIAALSKARGESQQGDVDKAAPKPKRVVWDMDMATPTKSVQ